MSGGISEKSRHLDGETELPDDQPSADCLHRVITFFATIVLPPERRARADECSVIRNSDREAR